jgi:hypothetical protein
MYLQIILCQDQPPASQRTKNASIKMINHLTLLGKSWPSVMSSFKIAVEKDDKERNVKFKNSCPLQLFTIFWKQVYIIQHNNSSTNDAENTLHPYNSSLLFCHPINRSMCSPS